jgi:4-hydroxy-tetrahydrodipicolinate reductase
MKLAVIGKGGTGQVVINRATADGHEVALIISSKDSSRGAEDLANSLRGLDAVIDFSNANAVLRNVEACMIANVSLVEGTTGWSDKLEEVRRIVEMHNAAFVYGANFSIGVNLFYRIVQHASELVSKVEGYESFIEEQHHSRKKDAPSGTALKLKKLVEEYFENDMSIAATRAGSIPGTHRVGFDSHADQILLTHEARSREGFAAGALFAAKWIQGKSGVYEFTQAIDEVLNQ